MPQERTRCDCCGYRVRWNPETREGPTVFFEGGCCPSCGGRSVTGHRSLPAGEESVGDPTSGFDCPLFEGRNVDPAKTPVRPGKRRTDTLLSVHVVRRAMSMNGPGAAEEWREIDRFEGGVGWIAHPDERMQRASHALAVPGNGDEDDVWVVDPVDVPGLDSLLATLGTVRGVVLLLDRHSRDAAEIASRHDVSVWLPGFFDGVAGDLDASVERFRHDLGDSGFAVHEVIDSRLWQEALLFDRNRGILVVPEAVGTGEYFLVGEERLGVHPMLRLKPPSSLTRLDPDHVLVGHGEGVHDDAAAALDDAVRGAQARTPALVAKSVRGLLGL